jgi:hypothetical protein
MKEACNAQQVSISEFTVAPQIEPKQGLPYHEWFIEFENEPKDLDAFSKSIDTSLQEQNSYYKDLIDGKILKPLEIFKVNKNGFKEYMKTQGKLGGQNKLPRLSNDRKIANSLYELQS